MDHDRRARRQISASDLGDFVARLFTAAGVPDDAARVVAIGLVDADLEGLHSHGVMLVDMYIERIRQGSVSRTRMQASSPTGRARSCSMPVTRLAN